jgi:hypothetical protein
MITAKARSHHPARPGVRRSASRDMIPHPRSPDGAALVPACGQWPCHGRHVIGRIRGFRLRVAHLGRLVLESGRRMRMLSSRRSCPRQDHPAPSFSGLGHRPFTAAARVRIPLGSPSDGFTIEQLLYEALWRSWLACRPVTAEVAGSSPVRVAQATSPFPFERRGFLLIEAPVRFVGRMSRGSVAQLVERSTENRKVTGSMPVGATEGNPRFAGGFRVPGGCSRDRGLIRLIPPGSRRRAS